MNAETQALLTALQAYFDINGESGIDGLVAKIDGYGDDATTETPWYGSTGNGARGFEELNKEIEGSPIRGVAIICVEDQPIADKPEQEAQRQANIRYWNMRRVLGSFAGMDNDQDGVSDRLRVPRQGVNYPGNQWPDFFPGREWDDPSVSPSLEGSRVVEGTMVYQNTTAAVESTRLVIAAMENGGVTPG